MNVAVLHANHFNNEIIKGTYLLGWHYHNDHNIHSLSNYGQRVQINDGGGRGVGKGENRQQLTLNAFTMDKKYNTFKIILKIW